MGCSAIIILKPIWPSTDHVEIHHSDRLKVCELELNCDVVLIQTIFISVCKNMMLQRDLNIRVNKKNEQLLITNNLESHIIDNEFEF